MIHGVPLTLAAQCIGCAENTLNKSPNSLLHLSVSDCPVQVLWNNLPDYKRIGPGILKMKICLIKRDNPGEL